VAPIKIKVEGCTYIYNIGTNEKRGLRLFREDTKRMDVVEKRIVGDYSHSSSSISPSKEMAAGPVMRIWLSVAFHSMWRVPPSI
jgi:hypothetical protein